MKRRGAWAGKSKGALPFGQRWVFDLPMPGCSGRAGEVPGREMSESSQSLPRAETAKERGKPEAFFCPFLGDGGVGGFPEANPFYWGGEPAVAWLEVFDGQFQAFARLNAAHSHYH